MDATAQRRPLPPEGLFVISAVSQYIGASIAVSVFDRVAPQTVGWLRVVGASVALLLIARPRPSSWGRERLMGAAVFGIATAAMNLFFYLAIARIDLGKSVAIEFIGPIAVAAATTRSWRNAAALATAVIGVGVLGGVELGDETLGVLFVLAASACWAAYIVIGSRVARVTSGVDGLGIGLAVGALALAPLGAPWSGPVWTSPLLLAACLATGVFSNAIGYGIDQHVLRRVSVRRFSVLLSLLPVTATAIGWVALDQRPGGLDMIGIALVLIAVASQEREQADVIPTDAA
ncbi:MAG: EamA family transporter [Actinobacteria bacterium]|nr:EamA family transporter [Actinomycetota bacterium]